MENNEAMAAEAATPDPQKAARQRPAARPDRAAIVRSWMATGAGSEWARRVAEAPWESGFALWHAAFEAPGFNAREDGEPSFPQPEDASLFRHGSVMDIIFRPGFESELESIMGS